MRKAFLLALSAMNLNLMAATVDATEPNKILEIAKGFGSAELSNDKHGDPLIQGRMEEYKYQIIFYDCENGKNCTTIAFDAAWEISSEVDLEKVNDWNQNKRFGRAFLDVDGDPALDWDVNLKHGVEKANLEDTFKIWKDLMQEYVDFIQ